MMEIKNKPTGIRVTQLPTDWLSVLVRILDCFVSLEGTLYESEWKDFGITDEECIAINKAWEEYCLRKQQKVEMKP